MAIKFVEEEATKIKNNTKTVINILSILPMMSVGLVNILSIFSMFLLRKTSAPITISTENNEKISKFNIKLRFPFFNSFVFFTYLEKSPKFKITIEAGSTDYWKKYVGNNGMNFGIDDFGKSAPFKDIYKYFGLEVSNIANKTKKLIKN